MAISSPSELNENAISSSLSALKASGSIKSSESSKSRRRLTEIREDAGEAHERGVDATNEGKVAEDSHNTAQNPEAKDPPTTATETESDSLGGVGTSTPLSPSAIEQSRANWSSGTQATGAEDSVDPLLEPQRRGTQTQTRTSFERRQSSQSLRPFIGDAQSPYGIKPKIKVGPRPSIEHTSATSSARPVSSLPAGVQMLQRQPKYQVERPKTQQNPSRPFFVSSATSPPMPTAASTTGLNRLDRPPSRAGSAVTVPTYTHYPDSLASEAQGPMQGPNVTPEKQRLMKALQKRRKAKMAKASPQDAKLSDSGADRPMEESPSTDCEPGLASDKTSSTSGMGDPPTNGDTATTRQSQHDARRSLTGQETPKTDAVKIPALSATGADPLQVSEQEVAMASQLPSTQPLREEGGKESLAINSEKEMDEEDVPLMQSDEEKAVLSSPVSHSASAGKDHPETDNKANAGCEAVTTINHLPTREKGAWEKPATTAFDSGVRALSPSNTEDKQAEPCEKAEAATSLPSSKAEQPSPIVNKGWEGPALSRPLEETTPTDEARDLETSNTEDLTFAEKIQTKRRGMISPIKTGDVSDATSLSGDSFLEELQTATVEEAKPMIVSKSPATPFFPLSPKSVGSQRSSEGTRGARSPSSANEGSIPPMPSNPGSPISTKENRSGSFGSLARFMPARSISNPLDSLPLQKVLPELPNGLSREASSSSLMQRQGAPAESNGSKKSGVSSMISQRIKALEKFSSGPQANSGSSIMTQSMVSRRKTSLTTPPVSSGGDTRESSRPSSPAAFPVSPPTPHGGSLMRRLRPSRDKSFESKQEGLSVTARIVRDDSNRVPTQPVNAAEPQAVNLHVSPLTVQHKTASSLFKTPKASRSKSKSSSTSSLSSSRDGGASSKRDSMSSRRSTSSRKDSVETLRPRSIASMDRAGSPESETKDPKKRSLLKRMSNISFSRRSIAQTMNPTLNQQPIMEHQEPEAPSGWASSVNIGDLNIQFPDTLACFLLACHPALC